MKHIIIAVTVLLFAAACTSKKKASATAESTKPTEAQLQAVKAKNADITMETLEKGHSIYYGACTRCHGAKNITSRSEEEWPKILDKMAPRAKLTQEEKSAVYNYVMGVKLTAK
jgi:cytochrome c5